MKKKSEKDIRKEELARELNEIQGRIDALYSNLSYIVEPELIDSCIYELNAFQSRYTFILRQVKEEDEVKIS